jgi:outer membrane protein
MRHLVAALLVASTPLAVPAQTPQPQQAGGPVLTLEEAIQLALRNNPAHLQSTTGRARAGTAMRTAYGMLLPSVRTNFGLGFRAGGTETFAGQQFGAASDQLSSSYGLNVSLGYSAGTFLEPRRASANLSAAEASVNASAQATRARVVDQYLLALQAQASAALADTLLINLQAQLELNRARQQVGAATTLEVRQAEVQVGRQQVALLTARNQVEIQTLILFQQIGVQKPEGVRLVTSFPMTEPALQLDELLTMAHSANPSLGAARERESATNVGVLIARSRWLPTVGFNANWAGFTQKVTSLNGQLADLQASIAGQRRSCYTTDSIRVGAGLAPVGGDCNRFTFTPEMGDVLRAANDRYPFDFTKNPFQYSIGISLPIFDNFQREQQIQEAQYQRNDARYQRRAEELRIDTEVTTAHRQLTTAYQTVRLNEQNQQAAREALELAQTRYRVGATTFVDVTQQRSAYEQAATDLINSIYAFHRAYAVLEAAVGRPLR